MTYPGDVSQDLDQLQRRVNSLSSDVDELRERCEEVRRQADAHEERTEEFERTVSEQSEELDELRRTVENDVHEIRSDLGRVASAVAWLKRRVRTDQDITPIDLDAVDEQTRVLAVRAQQGQQSAAVLLSPAQRRRHEQTITELDALRERIEQAATEALQQSLRIASTDYGTAEHQHAGTAYRNVLPRLQLDQARRAAAEAQAAESRAALDRDDANREVHSPQVATGESARQILRDRLRQRIADAVAADALMPAWFTTVLGHAPPAKDTEQWLATATSVLMYRVTYTVTDPVLALGARPDPTDTVRAGWHSQVEKDLQKAWRWPS